MTAPRVAFFTDSFRHLNGVALTSRQFLAFARRRGLPFLAVTASSAHPAPAESIPGLVELSTSPASFPLEFDLRFDLAFLRHRARLSRILDSFRPDLIHITSPGHLGILGALLAHERRIPLAASWHTNIHEYGARRLRHLLPFLPAPLAQRLCYATQRASLRATLRFYRLARLCFAPNRELVKLLRAGARRPCFLMERGVDTSLFSPARRRRADALFTIGFAGRLSAEKNVRLLARLEEFLRAQGIRDYHFLIAGEGAEKPWLAANLRQATLPGILRSEALAAAYASMDVFAFPSETDTFGNVVLEAAASGVPAVVTSHGGPKYLVEHGISGFVAPTESDFFLSVLRLYRDPDLRARMARASHHAAQRRSWDAVFESVYLHYAHCLPPAPSSPASTPIPAEPRLLSPPPLPAAAFEG